MRFIPTRIHGVLDYVVGIILILASSLLGFRRGGAETWVPVTLGVAALVYSLLTRYELGLIKVIPMPVHLTLDVLSGVVLVISPWLFGFAHLVWAPHLILGLFEIAAGLMTQLHPAPETTHVTAH
jgi:hypothetical protein